MLSFEKHWQFRSGILAKRTIGNFVAMPAYLQNLLLLGTKFRSEVIILSHSVLLNTDKAMRVLFLFHTVWTNLSQCGRQLTFHPAHKTGQAFLLR